MRLTVFGMGYLGLTHAVCMAELGHEVLGVEVDHDKVAKLANGEVPFYEPGLAALLKKHLESGLLRITTSYQDAADWGALYFIAVGTPQKKGESAADLRYVEAVIDGLVPLVRSEVLILGKSTVPVGTCAKLVDRARALSTEGEIEIAWNPEFLREGYAVHDTLTPDRIVLGRTEGGRAETLTREVYATILERDTPFIVTDPETAELVKVSANAFLATKISFINAIAEVCDAVGADVRAVADAIGYDARIGRRFLNAGLGFGGGCLPKDIRAFMARAGELGASEALMFLREVDNVNMRRRTRMVEVTRAACNGSLLGANIAILGSAFKPDSDDVRDSPALNVAGQLQLQGASVTVYDPKAIENSRRVFPTLSYANSVRGACENADVVLVLTEWSEFTEINPAELSAIVRRTTVIDGRLCLDREWWTKCGWRYLT
ncbi:UDP-glucose/GDP-mannose dehydrogenase family protein [Mycobacterium sp. SM3041]|uniref:UDP-glucose dehydrogenase family protein n=1 Tax=Mycobacterium sp. SM3041 TaxID=3114291 RepID=UPI003204FB23